MRVHLALFDTPPPDIPLPSGEPRLRIAERIDPEAADALWALALTPGWGQRPQSAAARDDVETRDHGVDVASW